MPRLTVALTLLLLAAGCAHGERSVLHQGLQDHFGRTFGISDAKARSIVATTERSWRRRVRGRARIYPRERFDNLPPAELRRRLASLSKRYGFNVMSIELFQPIRGQLAPKVVVETNHYIELAHATPAILEQLDPRRAAKDDRSGWRYEGFFFQANDERGVPFLATFNFRRGFYGAGGGQFARSEALYPFAHG